MSKSTTSGTDGLADLFPLPSPPPSLCPQRFPGVSHESSTTLVKLLKDSHARWHMYFNDRQFHNHIAHLLLAMYQIGATPELLEAGYRNDCTFQRPAYASPSAITDDNLYDHIGDEHYYTAYREFFNAAVRKEGINAFLEKYLFTSEANVPPKRMLNRFLAGLLHPIIHAGYGCEFGLPGMVAEGLAQLCTQDDATPEMFPPSVFSWHGVSAGAASSVASITTSLSSVGLNGKTNGSAVSTGPHALEILAKIANDPAFAPSAIGIPVENRKDPAMLCEVLEARGPELFELVSAWTVDGADKDVVYRKIEEIVWMNVVAFGVAGWGGRHSTPDKKFNGDFILLHLVTSTLFLHSYVQYLSASSISALVRAFFGASLGLYVARGRPALPICDFYASTTARPRAPGPAPTPHKDALTPTGITNPWFEVLQSTLAHKDDHLVKLQRALAHFATLYGTTPPGRFADLHGLNGAEVLDGSLFLRVAGLSQDRAGWMREGEEDKFWDFQGFFD